MALKWVKILPSASGSRSARSRLRSSMMSRKHLQTARETARLRCGRRPRTSASTTSGSSRSMTTFFDESINQLLGSFLAAASSLVIYEGSIERADGEREVEVDTDSNWEI